MPLLNDLKLFDYPRNVLPQGAFVGLDKLTYLYSQRGLFETVDIHAFRGLSSLRQLSFRDGYLAYLPPGSLEYLPRLASLVLVSNHLTSLHRDQFQGASELSWIDLQDNPLRVVESGAFSDLPIRYLDLRNADLTSLDLDVFSNLDNCALDLSGNRLTTLAPSVLAGAGLVSLDLSDNDISDISFLSRLRYAEEIDLSGNRVVDVSPLASIDISPLVLDLSRNRIVDISPLAGLSSQLTYLDLSHNGISDLSPLLERDGPMGEESSLFLYGNRLQSTASDEHVAMLRSWGVWVFDVRIWPMDSSAEEGEDFEFAVRLSSEIGQTVSVDWQLMFSQNARRWPAIGGAFLTATIRDSGPGSFGCHLGLCYKDDNLAGGQLTIGAMRRMEYATVSGFRELVAQEEEHETFAFVLLPSNLPDGVALDADSSRARHVPLSARQSVAVGLIVDPAGAAHDVPLFLGRGDAWGRQSVQRLVHPMDGSPAHVEVFDGLGLSHPLVFSRN